MDDVHEPSMVPTGDRREAVARILAHAAHLLPAQGPISVFVHHNTLHAFEDEPFELAVEAAAERFGCEPYLDEDAFRRELRRGRITAEDLTAALAADLGELAAADIAGLCRRDELRRAMLEIPFVAADGDSLAWILAETDALTHLHRGLPEATRRRWLDRERATRGRDRSPSAIEAALCRGLHAACLRAAARAPQPHAAGRPAVRPRDQILAATGVDSDAEVHPLLIRLAAAYLDQGVAYWPMQGRREGFLRAVIALHAEGPGIGATAELGPLLARAAAQADDPLGSIVTSLVDLGIEPADDAAFVEESLLALRGWAGMFHQCAERPDRAPVLALPATLADFVAVRLLLERAVLARINGDHSLQGRSAPAPVARPSAAARAFGLFQVAQALALDAAVLDALSEPATCELFAEIADFAGVARRRVFHLAYERRYRLETLDALSLHAAGASAPPVQPSFQAVFCIDDREESLRRHLEEVEPSCETLGIAGFFGVAMYYRGIDDAYPAPLCPLVIRPRHEVEEIAGPGEDLRVQAKVRGARVVGRLRRGVEVGSRTFARGTLLTALVGILAVIPMVFRVLAPRLTGRLSRGTTLWRGPTRTRLALDRRAAGESGAQPRLGEVMGYTKEEMAAVVRSFLEELGLTERLAPLVLVLGHGSDSLNNPHRSAYECGACGGGGGGPNARALAQMANDPAVRELLAADGLRIPAGIWFIGGVHNTCDDAIRFFDEDLVPAEHGDRLARARRALDVARTRDAHERCRRFEAAPTWLPPSMALAHVEARADDLAQVRPETGHATNALCIVGRRARTRGLFLDRRSFLVSYDPEADADGAILARILGGALPVCAGINLEYYFSRVDPAGYGAGTKLPHNITGLIGVMDGYESDLRTGLPSQMIELHEPVRLLVIVEASTARLLAVIDASPALRRLVHRRWIQLAALDPKSARLEVFDDGAFVPHLCTASVLATAPSSIAWYRGRRGLLPCAEITGAAVGEAR